MEHPTCNLPDCATCADRARLAALDLQRDLRPAGRLRLRLAKIKQRARRGQGGVA